MTSIDTEHFRAALLEEKARIEHALATLRDEHPGSLDDEVEEVAASADSHLGEAAAATLNREIDYTLGENSEQILSEIDAALKRIDDGTYGTCIVCGKKIPKARLDARPEAIRCIEHQQEYEEQYN